MNKQEYKKTVESRPNYIRFYEKSYQFADTNTVSKEKLESILLGAYEYRKSEEYWAEVKLGTIAFRYKIIDGELRLYKVYDLVNFKNLPLSFCPW